MKTGLLRACIVLIVLLAGCVARPITPTPQTIASTVEPGDRIHLVTRSGSEGDYLVVRVERDALFVQPRGAHDKDPKQSIAYGDIVELTVTRPDKTALGTGLVLTAIILGGVLLSEAMEAAAAPALCC